MSSSDYPTFESNVVADMKIFEVKEEGTAGQELVHKKDWESVLGVKPELPEGLAELIAAHKIGETGELNVKVDDQVFRYSITVKSFTSVNPLSFTPAERLTQGVRRKDDGNAFFEAKQGEKAIGKYELAAKFLEGNADGLAADKKVTNSKALQAAYTNVAQAYLTTSKWDNVIDRCDKCLAIDGNNLKALFRRGCASSALRNWDEARSNLQKVLELDGGSSDAPNSIAMSAKNELAAVEEKILELQAEK